MIWKVARLIGAMACCSVVCIIAFIGLAVLIEPTHTLTYLMVMGCMAVVATCVIKATV